MRLELLGWLLEWLRVNNIKQASSGVEEIYSSTIKVKIMNNKVNVMDIEKAIGNIYELISGVNPITNESLKDTELYCDD